MRYGWWANSKFTNPAKTLKVFWTTKLTKHSLLVGAAKDDELPISSFSTFKDNIIDITPLISEVGRNASTAAGTGLSAAKKTKTIHFAKPPAVPTTTMTLQSAMHKTNQLSELNDLPPAAETPATSMTTMN